MLTKGGKMSDSGSNLLVVDNAAMVLMCLSAILTESGYNVRTAHDGFSSLTEIRQEVPDLIISDLNMPRMSVFELLSVVRRRFPAIRVIAMSASYSGEGVPPGVAADAFYEKGSNPGFLVRIVEAMTRSNPPSHLDHPSALAPIWDSAQWARPGWRSRCHRYLHRVPQDLPAGSRQKPRRDPRSRMRLLLQLDSLCDHPTGESGAGFPAEAGCGITQSPWPAELRRLKQHAVLTANGLTGPEQDAATST